MTRETLTLSKELAPDGRGINRPAERAGVFVPSVAARVRALCAFKPSGATTISDSVCQGPQME